MNENLQAKTKELESLLRKVNHLLNRRTKKALEDFNLTPPQFFLLLTLHKKEEAIMSELVEKMHLSPPTATGIVDRLVKQDLVERFRDENDRRVVKVKLSSKGINQLKQVKKKRLMILENDLQELDNNQCSQLAFLLEKLYHSMTKNS